MSEEKKMVVRYILRAEVIEREGYRTTRITSEDINFELPISLSGAVNLDVLAAVAVLFEQAKTNFERGFDEEA